MVFMAEPEVGVKVPGGRPAALNLLAWSRGPAPMHDISLISRDVMSKLAFWPRPTVNQTNVQKKKKEKRKSQQICRNW